MRQPVVFFDLETGGLDLDKHPVIQMAAIVVTDWREVLSFERKLEFDVECCEEEALEMNSYDPDTWAAEAIPPAQAVRELIATCIEPYRWMPARNPRSGKRWRNAMFAGHNTGFDLERLLWLAKSVDEFVAIDLKGLDTIQLALWRVMKLGAVPPEDFKLTTLCQKFGIDTQGAHDALTDVRLCIELTRRCLEGNIPAPDPGRLNYSATHPSEGSA